MNDRPGRTPPAEPGVRVPRTSCGRPNAQPCEPSSAWLREVLSQQTVCPILHSSSSEFISHHIIGFVSQGPYIELSLAVLPSPRSRTELTVASALLVDRGTTSINRRPSYDPKDKAASRHT